MKTEKLGKIVKITSGGTPKRDIPEYYDNGNIYWVKTGDLKEKYISNTPEKITELGLQNSSAKIFPPRTVLLALYGATIGACSILKIEAATNQACAAILPSEKLNHEFLYYYLKSIQQQLVNRGQGGGQPNISGQILKETRIPLFSVSDQIRIANLISKVDGLIQKRKKSIQLLDEIVNAKFFEMFGEPSLNPMNWPKRRFGDIYNSIRYGVSTPPIYSKTGIPFVRATNIKNGRIVKNEMFYITKEEGIKISKCKIFEGDLLIVRSGANTGDAAVVTEEYNNSYAGFDLIIEIDKVYSIFYNHIINSEYGKKIIKPLTQRAGQPHINAEQVSNLKFYFPPKKLQFQFAQLNEKADRLKAKQQASLKELENLYQSLMQRAFSGDLELKEDVEWLNATGETDDAEPTESEYFKKKREEISEYREPEEIKSESDNFLKQLISFQKSVQKLKTPHFPESLIKQTKVLSQIAEDVNKISRLVNPSVLKAINNLTAFQNSPALKASIEASKNYEKIIQVASKYSQAGNAIFENTFEGEMSKIIKDNFTGTDFNFQMIVELLENEKAIVPIYLTSQELKDNYTKKDKSTEGLINERDIKTLIFESIEGKNPFLMLEQFYHNERQNPESLKRLFKYEELYKNVSSDERSGIYFRIIK